MRRVFALALATLAIIAPSQAFAGHEWTDGTMGPPQGRWYDTAMPQFPTRVRHSTPAEQPTALCDYHPDTKSDTAVAAASISTEVAAPHSRVTSDAKPNDTCSTRAR